MRIDRESDTPHCGTYNLLYNAGEMVKAGLGAAISINEILSDDIGLVFRPFDTLNSLNASLKIAL